MYMISIRKKKKTNQNFVFKLVSIAVLDAAMSPNISIVPTYVLAGLSNKVYLTVRKMHKCRSSCAYAIYHPAICYPSKHSMVSNDSFWGQQRPCSDCAGLCCLYARPHIRATLELLFSPPSVRLYTCQETERTDLYNQGLNPYSVMI